MDDYILNRESGIFLYGIGTLGSIVGRYLLEAGFRVLGYIDQRAGEIPSLYGVACYSIEKARTRIDKEQDVIFIVIKDVFEHENIKDFWFSEGFRRIVYKPLAVIDGAGNDWEKRISDVYDRLVKKELPKQMETPLVEERKHAAAKRIAAADGERCTVYIPIELIYTNRNRDGAYDWGDISIHALVPHLRLFRFFSGDLTCSSASYLAFCRENARRDRVETTEAWSRNVLRNRYHVFTQMERYLASDRSFFVRNAPEAEWNEKGFFNLKSGKHRAAFLAAKGMPEIACTIAKEDLQKWEAFMTAEGGERDPEEAFWRRIFRALAFQICEESLDGHMIPQYRRRPFLNLTGQDGFLTKNLIRFGLRKCENGETPCYVILDGKPGAEESDWKEAALFWIEDGSGSAEGTAVWRGMREDRTVTLKTRERESQK